MHLAALDHEQHSHGPFSPAAIAALEKIDKMLGELIGAIRASDKDATVCVVSDHGFARVDHLFKLDAALVRASLIRLKSQRCNITDSGIESWDAAVWSSGGSAAIMLHNPNDAAIRSKVRHLLDSLASDPANGIAAILDPPAIANMGGAPEAAF